VLSVVIWLGLSAAPASARKPIIAYVDQTTNKLSYYDTESGANVPAPNLTIAPPLHRFAVSFDGRYVVYEDATGKIHLFDRAIGAEIALPGVNIYSQPNGLSVSNTGLIAFDNNSNGPAVVYDSGSGSFVNTGLAATNGHRQTHLSADGKFLATTCITGGTDCAVNSRNSGNSTLFVQNLVTRTDINFPLLNGAGKDEEHPCIDGDGGLVGGDVNDTHRDVFIFSLSSSADLTAPFLNMASADTVDCVLSASGDYVGLASQTGVLRVYQTSTGTAVPVPATITAPFVWFISPYAPPAIGPPPPSPPPPSNSFSFGKVKLNKHNGTAELQVDLPAPGTLVLSGKQIKKVEHSPNGAGTFILKIIPMGKLAHELKTAGKAKTSVDVTFTPTGGSPKTEEKTLRLLRRR
jgi:hypothetical protein